MSSRNNTRAPVVISCYNPEFVLVPCRAYLQQHQARIGMLLEMPWCLWLRSSFRTLTRRCS